MARTGRARSLLFDSEGWHKARPETGPASGGRRKGDVRDHSIDWAGVVLDYKQNRRWWQQCLTAKLRNGE